MNTARWVRLGVFLLGIAPYVTEASGKLDGVLIDPQIGTHLLKETDQLSLGRLVRMQEIGPNVHDPLAPPDRPARYWRLIVTAEKTYRGRIKSGKEIELITIARPPQVPPSGLVLAYGTKTTSDQGRLWGNFLPVLTLEDGRKKAIPGATALAMTVSRTASQGPVAEESQLVSIESLAEGLKAASASR